MLSKNGDACVVVGACSCDPSANRFVGELQIFPSSEFHGTRNPTTERLHVFRTWFVVVREVDIDDHFDPERSNVMPLPSEVKAFLETIADLAILPLRAVVRMRFARLTGTSRTSRDEQRFCGEFGSLSRPNDRNPSFVQASRKGLDRSALELG